MPGALGGAVRVGLAIEHAVRTKVVEMFAVVSLLVVVALSILITRIATKALVHTGLPREAARFQARSAFTGVGFTTSEAELVVNHPVRRRIVRLLMLLGNVGIVTVISSLVLGFVGGGLAANATRLSVLGGGIVGLWIVAGSKQVDRVLERWMGRLLARYTDLDVRDHASLLHLAGEYHIEELACRPGDWMEDRTLAELRLREEGIVVLGITRNNGTYLGVPVGGTRIHAGDSLLLYGRDDMIEGLDERRRGISGDLAHADAVAQQRRAVAEERDRDRAAKEPAPASAHPLG